MKNTSSSKLSTVDPSVIKKANPVTKIVRIVVLGLSFVATVMSPAMAETFSIDGMALNTNNNFPLKDGHPILSTWRLNPSDNDQQFDRQGQLLRHRSTGKCLNAYQPSVGSIVNVYPCNGNDGDQKFAILSAGGNVNLIQRMGTNLCLDMDSRSQNTRMKLWNCSANFPNQRFVSNASTNPPPLPPIQGASQRKVNDFVNQWNGKTGITRFDDPRNELKGQCVTLIARYMQDRYGASRTSLALDHGRGTAASVARQFSSSFFPLSDPRDAIPGSIISFPSLGGGYGHVALVVSSTRNGNYLNIKIIDSNSDYTTPANGKTSINAGIRKCGRDKHSSLLLAKIVTLNLGCRKGNFHPSLSTYQIG